jgi:hypothetical protein
MATAVWSSRTALVLEKQRFNEFRRFGFVCAVRADTGGARVTADFLLVVFRHRQRAGSPRARAGRLEFDSSLGSRVGRNVLAPTHNLIEVFVTW